jgi:hypothetical protein
MDPEVSVLAFDPSAFEHRSVGVSHRFCHRHHSSEAVSNLKQVTKPKFHLKAGIKNWALKHPQGNKLKWRKCEPRV